MQELKNQTKNPLNLEDLRHDQPNTYQNVVLAVKKIETHFKEVQEIEFVIENGSLYILSSKVADKSAKSSIKAAVDMVHDKLLSKRESISQITPHDLNFFLRKAIDPVVNALNLGLVNILIGHGTASSPGMITGAIVFNYEDISEFKSNGLNVVLVRSTSGYDSLDGLTDADAVLTINGGITSPVACAARKLGKCAITGASTFGAVLDTRREILVLGTGEVGGVQSVGAILKKGDVVSVDGTSGNIYHGKVPMIEGWKDPAFQTIMSWASEMKNIKTYAQINDYSELKKAVELNADGIEISLCDLFLSDSNSNEALDLLSPSEEELMFILQNKFLAIYRLFDGKPLWLNLLITSAHELK